MAGNANSGRRQEKPFRDALRAELAAKGGDAKALRVVARKLIEQAEQGEQWAVRELADRMDGKAVQGIEHSGQIELTHEEALAALR